MKKDITELYCCVEDFCRMVDENFANMLLPNAENQLEHQDPRNSYRNPIISSIPMQKF